MAPKKDKDMDILFCEMNRHNYEAGSYFYAKATYLASPNNFFIIPFPFIKFLRQLSKPGNPISPTELRENMIVIYRSENPDANKYFKIKFDQNMRGVIKSINKDKTCQVYAMDRGFTENNVTLDRLFSTSTLDSIVVPSLVQKCELFCCEPIGDTFSKNALEAFEFYVGNNKLDVLIRGVKDGKLGVVIYNKSPNDVATMLELTHYIHVKEDSTSDPVPMAPRKLAYKHKALNLHDILKVVVLSGSTLKGFYVTQMEDYKEYVQTRPSFTTYCRGLICISDEDFKTGAIVGVYETSNMCFERGFILEVLNDKAKVKLVDWGVEKIVSKHNLKAVESHHYLMTPVLAIYCAAAEGFEPWDNGFDGFLHKGYSILIKIKQIGFKFEQPHTVYIGKAEDI